MNPQAAVHKLEAKKIVEKIVGSNGQEGQLIKNKLKSIAYSIVGITLDTMDITNSKKVSDLISSSKLKEVNSLTAFHHSSDFRRKY